ncbi:MAG: alpha/beta hydrolase [Gemmataceae bacterium]|nr:alpha/beta hydrolase [Gemmataceae bacterium]MDW8265876.1 alpha/beta hydrolase [Gemmataceae bacterium]
MLGRRLLRWCFKGLTIYAGVVVLLWLLEDNLLYHPIRADRDWRPAPLAVEDVHFPTADGTLIHAWWLAHPQGRGALLYLHGNAGNLSHRGFALEPLRQSLDVSVLIIDYPGYGRSTGRPSEAGCYAAGRAAMAWLAEQGIAADDVILFGKSLGGGVATELATEFPHRALVLVKTFTSVPDVAAEMFPWLPVRLCVRNRFDNLTKLSRCPRPIFIAQGDCDRLISPGHGERLYEAAPSPKELLWLTGCDHNDPLPEVFYRRLRQFLDQHAPRS